MATREEYLQKFEDRMLDTLTENYKSLNKNLIFLYTLLFVLLVFKYQMGNEVELASVKLKLDQEQRSVLMPLLIMIPYLLINYAVLNIARLVKVLRANSDELKNTNQDARSFQFEDLEVYATGIAGMQLQFAAWIVTRHLNVSVMDISFNLPRDSRRKAKFTFARKLPFILINWVFNFFSRLAQAALWTSFLVLLYILPLVITLIIVFNEQVHALLATPSLLMLRSYYFWLCVSMVGMAFYTLACNWVLYVFYFEELLKLSKRVRTNGIQGIVAGCKAIYLYFTGEP